MEVAAGVAVFGCCGGDGEFVGVTFKTATRAFDMPATVTYVATQEGRVT